MLLNPQENTEITLQVPSVTGSNAPDEEDFVEGDWSDEEDEDFEDHMEVEDDLNEIRVDDDLMEPDPEDDDHLPEDDLQ